MAEERLDAAISIRITTRMKTMIEDAAMQMGIKPSAYAFRLLKNALEIEENSETSLQSSPHVNNVNNVDNTQRGILIASLQARIAGLEEQLEAMQDIVDNAQSIREEANKAISTIDATVESAVQRAVDSCTQFVDTRIQEAINKEMAEVLGETVA